jgi:hypothetical protein
MDDITRVSWRKSSYSSGNGGNCVEVASTPRTVAVRDSKDPHGPALAITAARWQAFTDALRDTAQR